MASEVEKFREKVLAYLHNERVKAFEEGDESAMDAFDKARREIKEIN